MVKKISSRKKKKKSGKSKKQVKKVEFSNLMKSKNIIPAVVIVALAVIILIISRGTTGYSEYGDEVKLKYTFELENGTIIEDGWDFFTVGEISSNFVLASNKLDEIVMGINKGEVKTIVLAPKDGDGEYDPTKVETINRTREMNRTIILPYSSEGFELQFNRSPKIGEILPFNELWNVTVLEFTEDTMTARHEIKDGQLLPLPPDGNVVATVTDEKVIFRYNPGKQLSNGAELVDVVDITENEFVIDYNPKYAGKNIIVTLEVMEIKKKEIINDGEGVTGFVTCLESAGFKIYGANWCGWTKKAVEAFGGFNAVGPIYVECTEEQALCQEKGVDSYPTMLLNNKPYTGERTFEGYAQATGCKSTQEITSQVTDSGSSAGESAGEEITEFVTCLESAGLKIYGANWCGWTKKAVDAFGGFNVVAPIYVECTEEQALCQEKGVDSYPTILLNDNPYKGERTFEGYAQATGCKSTQEIIGQVADSGAVASC